MTTSLTELLGRISAGWGKKLAHEDHDDRPSWSSIRQAMDVPTRREMAHRHMLQKPGEWIKSAGQGMSVVDLDKVAEIIDSYGAAMLYQEVQARTQEMIASGNQSSRSSLTSVLLQEITLTFTRAEAMAQITDAVVEYQRRVEEEDPNDLAGAELYKAFKKKSDRIILRCILSGVAFPSKYLQLTPEIFEALMLHVSATSPITEEELKEVIVLMSSPGPSIDWEIKGFNSFSMAMTIRTQVVRIIERMRSPARSGWPSLMVAHTEMLSVVEQTKRRPQSDRSPNLHYLGYKNNADSVNAMCMAVTLGFLTHGIMPARGLFLLTRQGVDYLRRCGIIEEATNDDND